MFITFKAGGSISTSGGPQTTFDCIEDSLFGVINKSGHAITSFNIAGPGIGGFDGDGINGYANGGPIANNASDTTGYGGLHAWFTNVSANAVTVNFLGCGIASGSSDFFSLEKPAVLNLIVVTNGVSEPSTYAMLLAGIVALGFISRRRQR